MALSPQEIQDRMPASTSPHDESFQLVRFNLWFLRRRRGFSQKDLSRDCFFDRTYLGKIERGDRDPTLRVIQRVSECLDVHPSEFFVEPFVRLKNKLTTNNAFSARLILEYLDDLVGVADPEGSLFFVNRGVSSFAGTPGEEFVDCPIWEIPELCDEGATRDRIRRTVEDLDATPRTLPIYARDRNNTLRKLTLSLRLIHHEPDAGPILLAEARPGPLRRPGSGPSLSPS